MSRQKQSLLAEREPEQRQEWKLKQKQKREQERWEQRMDFGWQRASCSLSEETVGDDGSGAAVAGSAGEKKRVDSGQEIGSGSEIELTSLDVSRSVEVGWRWIAAVGAADADAAADAVADVVADADADVAAADAEVGDL